jgi:hypothetical protein
VYFDGQWKRHKMTEDAYKDAFARANTSYAQMVGALVAALGTPAS